MISIRRGGPLRLESILGRRRAKGSCTTSGVIASVGVLLWQLLVICRGNILLDGLVFEDFIFEETVSPEQSSGSSVTKTAVMPKKWSEKQDGSLFHSHSLILYPIEGARGMSERERYPESCQRESLIVDSAVDVRGRNLADELHGRNDDNRKGENDTIESIAALLEQCHTCNHSEVGSHNRTSINFYIYHHFGICR